MKTLQNVTSVGEGEFNGTWRLA